MNPGIMGWPGHHQGQGRSGVIWPAIVAILFAALAAISFAVEHSLTVQVLENLPIETEPQ
jgi:hypothetical protein